MFKDAVASPRLETLRGQDGDAITARPRATALRCAAETHRNKPCPATIAAYQLRSLHRGGFPGVLAGVAAPDLPGRREGDGGGTGKQQPPGTQGEVLGLSWVRSVRYCTYCTSRHQNHGSAMSGTVRGGPSGDHAGRATALALLHKGSGRAACCCASSQPSPPFPDRFAISSELRAGEDLLCAVPCARLLRCCLRRLPSKPTTPPPPPLPSPCEPHSRGALVWHSPPRQEPQGPNPG